MSSFLARLGHACFRRRRLVVGLWVLVLAAVVGLVVTVGGRFDDEFSIPGSESQEALDRLGELAPTAGGVAAQIVLVAPEGASVGDPEYAAAVSGVVEAAGRAPQVAAVADPFATRAVSL